MIAVGTFLKLNGYRLLLSDRQMEELVVSTAEGQHEVPELAKKPAEGSEAIPGA